MKNKMKTEQHPTEVEIQKIYEDYGQLHEEYCEINREDGSDDGCNCAVKTMVEECTKKATEIENLRWVEMAQAHRKHCTSEGNKILTRMMGKKNKPSEVERVDEDWKERFYNKFSFIQAIKNEKSGNSYERVADFIQSEKHQSYLQGKEEERKSWINQSANEHDKRIRKAVKEEIRGMLMGMSREGVFNEVTLEDILEAIK